METTLTKRYLSWEEIQRLVDHLVRTHLTETYDAMLVITRGGMVPGCLISEKIDLRNILVAAVVYYTDVDRTLDKPIFLQFPSDTLLVGKRILVVLDEFQTLTDPARQVFSHVIEHAQFRKASIEQGLVQILARGFALRQQALQLEVGARAFHQFAGAASIGEGMENERG